MSEKKTRKEWEEGLFNDPFFIGTEGRDVKPPTEKPEEKQDWTDNKKVKPIKEEE